MSSKELKYVVKLQVPAGKALPGPPVGPVLGPKGVNAKVFCDEFNAKTKDMPVGRIIPIIMNIYSDRTFTFIMKHPPVSALIKELLKLEKCSKLPGRESISTVKLSQLVAIAQLKMPEMLGVSSEENALRSVCGTATSMGIKIEYDV